MKRSVWENKSNGQLCVTIPKDSGVSAGEVVEVTPRPIKRVAYSFVVGDLFHYGHLQALEFAKKQCDYNVVGVLTDNVVEGYRFRPIANLKERKAVINALTCVDRVVVQDILDPTAILKQLHEEFPDSELILIKGDNWHHVPGKEFVEGVGGKLVSPPYYNRLSTFKIVNKLMEYKDKIKGIKSFSSFMRKEDTSQLPPDTAIISTKANTLKTLQSTLKKSVIEDMYVFTIAQWKTNHQEIINRLQQTFAGGAIAVRSSAIHEDTFDQSQAGCFASVLNVGADDSKAVEQAVKTVISSYRNKKSESSFNQILVQRQSTDITMSGVVFTRTLGTNAPYYVINYDESTGKTDTVTSGVENKVLYISCFAQKYPKQFLTLMESVKELEHLFPAFPLDVEFGVSSSGSVIIYQVRPLAANMHKAQQDEAVKKTIEHLKSSLVLLQSPQQHLSGETTIFADMPDWNPAEIIGDTPNMLDCSLYQYVITDSAWHEARTQQGYYTVHPAPLVVRIGNKPYIDVRSSFNSFVPATLSSSLRDKLVCWYLKKLRTHPELQDKIEFEIAYTCFDLGFDDRAQELVAAGFASSEITELRAALLELTNRLVVDSQQTIPADLTEVRRMEEQRCTLLSTIASQKSAKSILSVAQQLLDGCRNQGTVQFSKLARLGFIAKILLKSLVRKQVISQAFYDDFFASVTTVASDISADHARVAAGLLSEQDFIKKYYHLRPGTYDITSLRYDKSPLLLSFSPGAVSQQEKSVFTLDSQTEKSITQAFREAGLTFDAQTFFLFAKAATEARELAKFEFTKNLSDAIELIAQTGETLGFTRQELAYLDVQTLFAAAQSPQQTTMVSRWQEVIKTREQEQEVYSHIVLPPVLVTPADLDVVSYYVAKPNFITTQVCEASLVQVSSTADPLAIKNIKGNIVVIEQGDPGYDWIFTRQPAGLITKYGGVASHMAIRCAEFGIPAAIGCGEAIFNRIQTAQRCVLDCKKKTIEVH